MNSVVSFLFSYMDGPTSYFPVASSLLMLGINRLIGFCASNYLNSLFTLPIFAALVLFVE